LTTDFEDEPERLFVPIASLQTQEFKKDRDVSFGFMTKLLDAFLTSHGRSVGVFLENEKIQIHNIEVNKEHSVIDGTIYRQESN
jgi:hypothetical protein